MNRLFVNIKVDREERPDVDAIYMDRGASPDGSGRLAADGVPHPRRQPFYGGTYYPKPTSSS